MCTKISCCYDTATQQTPSHTYNLLLSNNFWSNLFRWIRNFFYNIVSTCFLSPTLPPPLTFLSLFLPQVPFSARHIHTQFSFLLSSRNRIKFLIKKLFIFSFDERSGGESLINIELVLSTCSVPTWKVQKFIMVHWSWFSLNRLHFAGTHKTVHQKYKSVTYPSANGIQAKPQKKKNEIRVRIFPSVSVLLWLRAFKWCRYNWFRCDSPTCNFRHFWWTSPRIVQMHTNRKLNFQQLLLNENVYWIGPLLIHSVGLYTLFFSLRPMERESLESRDMHDATGKS